MAYDGYGTRSHEDWLIDMERDDEFAAEDKPHPSVYGGDGPWNNGGGDEAPKANGVLHWGQRTKVGDTVQSAWYDHDTFRVPVTGTVDTGRIHKALYRRWANGLTGSSVGGYITPGKVIDNGDGTVNVERIYHLGD